MSITGQIDRNGSFTWTNFLFNFQELIPVILCSAIHHPETKERDNLLHMLFNLIKRPDEDQRY